MLPAVIELFIQQRGVVWLRVQVSTRLEKLNSVITICILTVFRPSNYLSLFFCSFHSVV